MANLDVLIRPFAQVSHFSGFKSEINELNHLKHFLQFILGEEFILIFFTFWIWPSMWICTLQVL